jgi:hypothetical protein
VGVREAMEWNFLNCIVQSSDSVMRSAILDVFLQLGVVNLSNVNNDTKVLTPDLLRNFLSGNDCVSDYGPMSERRAGYSAVSLLPETSQLCRVVINVFEYLGSERRNDVFFNRFYFVRENRRERDFLCFFFFNLNFILVF